MDSRRRNETFEEDDDGDLENLSDVESNADDVFSEASSVSSLLSSHSFVNEITSMIPPNDGSKKEQSDRHLLVRANGAALAKGHRPRSFSAAESVMRRRMKNDWPSLHKRALSESDKVVVAQENCTHDASGLPTSKSELVCIKTKISHPTGPDEILCITGSTSFKTHIDDTSSVLVFGVSNEELLKNIMYGR